MQTRALCVLVQCSASVISRKLFLETSSSQHIRQDWISHSDSNGNEVESGVLPTPSHSLECFHGGVPAAPQDFTESNLKTTALHHASPKPLQPPPFPTIITLLRTQSPTSTCETSNLEHRVNRKNNSMVRRNRPDEFKDIDMV